MKKLKVEAMMRRRNKKGHNLQEKNQQEEWGLGNIKAEEVPDVVFPDVVFLLRSRVDSGIHVYALDTREFLTLKLLFTFSPPDPLGQMSFVGLGSTLYAVGGGYDPDSGEYPKTFLICNLKNWRERDDFQWEKRDVAFKGAKPFPIVVAVNGMIYALAGCTLHGPPIGVDNNLDPVFEFFDPDKDYWQTLPPPPFSALYSELGGPHFYANTVIGNTIYVAMWVGLGRSDIYSFHVVDRKWSHITIQDPSCDVIQRNLVKCRWEGHVEVAGNKLFHYWSGAKTGLLRLYACDLGATREDPPEKEEEEKVLGESQHCEGGDDDGLHLVRELDSLISWDKFASTHIASYDSDDDWPIYCDTRCVYLPLRGLTVLAGLVLDDDNAGFVTHLGGKVYCFVYFYTLPNAQDAEDGRIGVCTFEAVEQQVGMRFLEVKILHSTRHPISRDLDFYEDWCKIQGATKLVKGNVILEAPLGY